MSHPIQEISELKKKLEKILSKYGVKEPEEMERKIERGELPEHPTYEDFLSALALKNYLEGKSVDKKTNQV
jgi:hypothetical protein